MASRVLGVAQRGSSRSSSPLEPGGNAQGTPPLSNDSTSPSISSASILSGGHGDHSGPAGYGKEVDMVSRSLQCPICLDGMVTEGQLNQHLDDAHGDELESDPARRDSIRTWFKSQISTLQPTKVLSHFRHEPFVRNGEDGARVGIESAKVTDSQVSRAHWQRETGRDVCSAAGCDATLGVREGRVNCRHCGRLFCEQHSMFQMKLSRSANHEPVHGIWCRVCRDCYIGRDGYGEMAQSRDRTNEWKAARQPNVEKANLHTARLRKRLDKLLSVRAELRIQDTDQLFLSAKAQSQLRQRDQQVVVWEADEQVTKCPFCQQSFTFFNRRHHCRTCGRVVCHDTETDCTGNITVDAISKEVYALDHGGSRHGSVSVCRDCRERLVRRSDNTESPEPPYARSYEILMRYQRGVESLMPQFQDILHSLKAEGGKDISKMEMEQATQIRKKLLDAFGRYETTSKRFARAGETKSWMGKELGQSEQKLCRAIALWARSFLQANMLPLQALPKLLKGDEPERPSESEKDERRRDQEEMEIRQQITVIEEQMFLVGEMIRQAERKRKYDDAELLKQSCQPLQAELDGLMKKLNDL